MLTCYSAVLYLLFVYGKNNTVTVSDAQQMVGLTPTERIEFVANDLNDAEPAELVVAFVEKYERFLEVSGVSEEELIGRFSDDKEAHTLRDEQSEFGDLAYRILYSIGHDNRLYRRLVI
jgi:hypothetical protein